MEDIKKSNQLDKNVNGNKHKNGECFVIMPFGDPEGYQPGHFTRIYEDIFKPAINNAGFYPHRADEDNASNLIQPEIIKKLVECPMVLCDLSSRNPNVLFELGIRQAFDKPVVLVQECNTPRIFDIASIKTIDYKKEDEYHVVLEAQEKIKKAIEETWESRENNTSINSIINLVTLIKPASLKPIEGFKDNPAMQYIISELSSLKSEIRKNNRKVTSNIEEGYDEYSSRRTQLTIMENTETLPTSEFIDNIKDHVDYYKELAEALKSKSFKNLSEKYEALYLDCLKFIAYKNMKKSS